MYARRIVLSGSVQRRQRLRAIVRAERTKKTPPSANPSGEKPGGPRPTTARSGGRRGCTASICAGRRPSACQRRVLQFDEALSRALPPPKAPRCGAFGGGRKMRIRCLHCAYGPRHRSDRAGQEPSRLFLPPRCFFPKARGGSCQAHRIAIGRPSPAWCVLAENS